MMTRNKKTSANDQETDFGRKQFINSLLKTIRECLREDYYEHEEDKKADEVEVKKAKKETLKEDKELLIKNKRAKSHVIGVEAPWGSGKSYVLRKLSARIDKDKKLNKCLIRVDFDPWHYADDADLIEAFFREVADSLNENNNNKSAQDLGRVVLSKFGDLYRSLTIGHIFIIAFILPLFIALASNVHFVNQVVDVSVKTILLLSVIVFAPRMLSGSNLGGFLGAIQNYMKAIDGEATLKGTRDQLAEILEEKLSGGQRILVTIEDIDRLTHRETLDILQLLHKIANFPQIIFLVAYDREQVARAVATEGSKTNIAPEDKQRGYEAIRKVITKPLQLHTPMADFFVDQVNEHILNHLDAVKPNLDTLVVENIIKLINKGYYKAGLDELALVVSTPREMKVILERAESLMFAMDYLCNPLDVLVISFLTENHPDIYNKLHKINDIDSFIGYVDAIKEEVNPQSHDFKSDYQDFYDLYKKIKSSGIKYLFNFFILERSLDGADEKSFTDPLYNRAYFLMGSTSEMQHQKQAQQIVNSIGKINNLNSKLRRNRNLLGFIITELDKQQIMPDNMKNKKFIKSILNEISLKPEKENIYKINSYLVVSIKREQLPVRDFIEFLQFNVNMSIIPIIEYFMYRLLEDNGFDEIKKEELSKGIFDVYQSSLYSIVEKSSEEAGCYGHFLDRINKLNPDEFKRFVQKSYPLRTPNGTPKPRYNSSALFKIMKAFVHTGGMNNHEGVEPHKFLDLYSIYKLYEQEISLADFDDLVESLLKSQDVTKFNPEIKVAIKNEIENRIKVNKEAYKEFYKVKSYLFGYETKANADEASLMPLPADF